MSEDVSQPPKETTEKAKGRKGFPLPDSALAALQAVRDTLAK